MNDQQVVDEHVELGKTGLMVPPMGTGAWAWGDRLFWGYGRGYSDEQVKQAFDISMASGINFFDTAEVYGSGKSERLLGQFTKEISQPVIIATKFMPFPWRVSSSSLEAALRRRLNRLRREQVDLYQIHWPFPPFPVERWARQLAKIVQLGLTRTVGVSNYSLN